jgi:hypothetical protein
MSCREVKGYTWINAMDFLSVQVMIEVKCPGGKKD